MVLKIVDIRNAVPNGLGIFGILNTVAMVLE